MKTFVVPLLGVNVLPLHKYIPTAYITLHLSLCRPIFDGTAADGLSSQTQACAAAADTACEASAGCASCDTDNCNTEPEVIIILIVSYYFMGAFLLNALNRNFLAVSGIG